MTWVKARAAAAQLTISPRQPPVSWPRPSMNCLKRSRSARARRFAHRTQGLKPNFAVVWRAVEAAPDHPLVGDLFDDLGHALSPRERLCPRPSPLPPRGNGVRCRIRRRAEAVDDLRCAAHGALSWGWGTPTVAIAVSARRPRSSTPSWTSGTRLRGFIAPGIPQARGDHRRLEWTPFQNKGSRSSTPTGERRGRAPCRRSVR